MAQNLYGMAGNFMSNNLKGHPFPEIRIQLNIDCSQFISIWIILDSPGCVNIIWET